MCKTSRGYCFYVLLNAKLIHMCLNISACISLCVWCLYAWVPLWVQRPGWARTESCAQQLPATASDRHSTALISWLVTIDTHSCAALREQTKHRPRLQGAGKASSENTDTDEHFQDFCHLHDKGRHLMLLPKNFVIILGLFPYPPSEFLLTHSSMTFRSTVWLL